MMTELPHKLLYASEKQALSVGLHLDTTNLGNRHGGLYRGLLLPLREGSSKQF